MRNLRSKGARAAIAAIMLMCGNFASAAQFSATGAIAYLRSSESSTGTDQDYFALSGVASLGTCGVYQGSVIFFVKDDAKGQRQFAILLSALRAGAPLTVYVDDLNKNGSGFCFVRTVE